MNLREIFSYKNKMSKLFSSDKEMVQLITDYEDVELPAKDLAYTHLFPYEFVPDTSDEARTFVCFDVDMEYVYEKTNKTFYYPIIYVWIVVHKSKLRLKEGGVRLDGIANRVDELLNGNRFFGIGTLELHTVERWRPNRDYLGRTLVYHTREWNRGGAGAPIQKVPSNRGDML